MTRSKFRRFWMITLGLMLAAVMYSYNKYTETGMNIDSMKYQVDNLTLQQQTGNQLTASLADLDSRTINERESTRLDILRYLGLEESRLGISISPAVERNIGGTRVATRDVVISGEMRFEDALSQLDYFYNTKKISIRYVEMVPTKESYDGVVKFSLGGMVYGLQK